MVALSVSISAITSPGFTGSPSFFSHLARLPFSIVGDSAGIRILIGMFGSCVETCDADSRKTPPPFDFSIGPFARKVKTCGRPQRRCRSPVKHGFGRLHHLA